MAPKNAATRTKPDRQDSLLPVGGKPTWEIVQLFPAQGSWTEHDYLALDGCYEGFPLVELSNGRLEVLPMPTQTHQLIVVFFFELLKAFTAVHAPGLVLFSGMRVRFQKGTKITYRQPDVLYMKGEHAERRQEKYWDGADLVMEVVSPDPKDRARDLEEKRLDYARARIPEYWIVDPQQRRIGVLALQGQRYKVHGEFGPGTQATSVLLRGFAVSVDEVLAAAKK